MSANAFEKIIRDADFFHFTNYSIKCNLLRKNGKTNKAKFTDLEWVKKI
jgi:hypothetical protein